MSKKSDLVPVEVMSSGLHIEGMRVSKKEIAELMLQEKDMELEDQYEAQQKLLNKLNKETIDSKFFESIQEEFLSKEKMKAVNALFNNKEYTINITLMTKSGHQFNTNNITLNTNNITQLVQVSRDQSRQAASMRGQGYNPASDHYDITEVIASLNVKNTNGVRNQNSINLSEKASSFSIIKEFEAAIQDMVDRRKVIEEEMAAIQDERRNLSKNYRRVTSRIMKNQLSQTEAGKKLVEEIEGIVQNATTKALPAPVVLVETKKKATKKSKKK